MKECWKVIQIGLYIILILASIICIIDSIESFKEGYIRDGVAYILPVIYMYIVYKYIKLVDNNTFDDY